MLNKLLITGISGLLGSNIALESSTKNYEISGIYKSNKINIPNIKVYTVDLSTIESTQIIIKLKPDIIIHCAAPTNLDYLEENPDEAKKHIINATKNMVDAARINKSKLIHISTDAIFDGEKGNYKEEDNPNPINVYGKAKLKAENEVKKLENYIIVRTNIYGWNSQNKQSLAEWMLTKLRNKEELPSFYDIKFSPILVNDLAKILIDLSKTEFVGTLNIASKTPVTKLEFAEIIVKTFNLDKSLIIPTTSDTINFKAKRPKNMSLNTEKAQKIFNLPTIEQGLINFKNLENSGYSRILKSYSLF